ncbi:MAG: hypothetical protein JWS12_754 [Candidatus Saccharibacteria bacterium]|nr:hypothetical protein [Candidatus Saccharibacteria bacterium]
MMSITDMMEEAAEALANNELSSARAWLSEIEAHRQFVSDSEASQLRDLVGRLRMKHVAIVLASA